MYTLGENALITVPFAGLDIGGTNTAAAAGGTAAQNHWASMVNHARLTAYLQVGAQTAGDSVLTITVQQAQDAVGTGLKTIETFTLADGTLDTLLDNLIYEFDAGKLDAANNFTHVRLLASMTDNANVDSLTMVYVRYQARSGKNSWSNYQLRLPQDQSPD